MSPIRLPDRICAATVVRYPHLFHLLVFRLASEFRSLVGPSIDRLLWTSVTDATPPFFLD